LSAFHPTPIYLRFALANLGAIFSPPSVSMKGFNEYLSFANLAFFFYHTTKLTKRTKDVKPTN
jgi:hypothetical protein